MSEPYRGAEPDPRDLRDRLNRLEPRVSELEGRINDAPTFKARWKARAEALQAGVWWTFFVCLSVWGLWGFVASLRGCANERDAAAAERNTACSSVCEAMEMHGAAREVVVGSGETPRSNCYCSDGFRLVLIDSNGIVTTSSVVEEGP